MLRAVLLGVLSLSVVGCKSSSETAKSQAGVAAGKVIEVSGTVTVRHGDVARPLVNGDTVEGDDTIETGADGHVLIELVHNNATWELNANKKSKVRESLAWSEPKRDRSAKAVEQDTAAAGRPAERNAAETTASAKADEQAPTAPPTAQAAPGAAPAAVTAAPAAATAAPPAPEPALEKTARGGEVDGKIAPKASRRDIAPPPPPPSPTESITPEVAPGAAAAPTGGTKGERARAIEDAKSAGTLVEGGAAGGGGGGGTGGKIGSTGAFGVAGGGSAAKTLVRAKSDDLSKCWAGQKLAVTIRIVIKADGTAASTVKTLTGSAVTPQVESCVKKVIGTIEFPAKADTVSLTLGS